MDKIEERNYHQKYVDTSTYEEKVDRIKKTCQGLRDNLIQWGKQGFIVGYHIKELKIHIYVIEDLGFDVEGWGGFFVETHHNCGILDPSYLALYLEDIEIVDKA